MVDALAGILAAEDARRYDAPLLQSAAHHPDPIVRRRAALALGRIGDPAATSTLLELLTDPDSTVQQDAAFALGLLRDPAALARLRDLVLNTPPGEQGATHAEAVTAIAKIGGGEAAGLLEELLVRRMAEVESGNVPLVVVQALGEAWRLGNDMPTTVVAQLAEVGQPPVRHSAVYSLSRLRAPGGANVLLAAANDPDPELRALAARALTRAYADTAGLDPGGLATRLSRLVEDDDPGVRINALRSLGTYQESRFAGAAADRTSDPEPNVRVQALATVGRLGGSDAAAVLAEHVDGGPFALRREALLGLARVDRGRAIIKSAAWITDESWQMRAVGAQALGLIGGDTAVAWLGSLLEDADMRVAARAFGALADASRAQARAVARELLLHADPVVRTLAAGEIQVAPRGADAGLLVDAYERSLSDPIPDARIGIVEALGAVSNLGMAERVAVEQEFLRRFPSCDDYLVRQAAEEHLPAIAARWGPAFPVETGRDIDDYRDIARRLVLAVEQGAAAPRLTIETDRGRITISLFAADAPMTVNALLELTDQRFFDGGSWHRVVPNFVIQDGDPRGDGWGGPGFALRDEVNRRRYGRGTVGMALSGPDTGGSQFFITHAPQPHLDGTYTVIGRVDGGMNVVDRITQGDRIRTIRRR